MPGDKVAVRVADRTRQEGTMALSIRRVFPATAGLIWAAWLLSACSSPALSEAVGSGGDTAAPIVVETSESAVTIENHAGRSLLNVRISIDAVDTTNRFIHVVPVIDVGQKTNVALTEFRSEDATLLDPISIHPKQVTVTARDTLAKTYEITIPWKQ